MSSVRQIFWLKPEVIVAYGLGLLALADIIDTTIVTVVIPQMMTSLNTTIDRISMVTTSYLITIAIFSPVSGLAIKKLGMRNLILFSGLLFTIASILCGLAETLTEMILFRSLQGMAGALLPVIAQAYVLNEFKGDKRNLMAVILGGIVVLGPIIGPVLGGTLSENLNWRYVFFVNVPVCAIGMALVFLYMKKDKPTKASIDYISFLFLVVGVGCFQYAIDQGTSKHWFQSYEICIIFDVALFFIGFFIWRSKLGLSVVNVKLFKQLNFILNNVAIFVFSLAVTGVTVYFPAMLQQVYGYSTETSGFLQTPRGIAAVLSAPLMSWLIDMLGGRLVMFLGGIGFGISAFMMAGFSPVSSEFYLLCTTIVQGIAMMAIFIPGLTLMSEGLTPSENDDASGIFNFFRNIGASIGVSIASTLVAHQMDTSYHDLATYLSPFARRGCPACQP